MKTIHLALLASAAATPLLAQETREMEAHVHGVSTLELNRTGFTGGSKVGMDGAYGTRQQSEALFT